MTKGNLLHRIEIDEDVMLGKPVIRGTRIPVETILRKLANNISVGDILSDYPKLRRQDIQAAILYAAEAIGLEELHIVK